MNGFKDIKNEGIELVYFTTTWCPDCIMMKPVINAVKVWAQTKDIAINVVNIDADEHNLYKTNNDWDVRKVGSFFMLLDGERHHLGYEYLPLEVFTDKIEQLVKEQQK